MLLTEYKKDYVNWGVPPSICSMRPGSAFLALGGSNFMSSTIYKNEFRDKHTLSAKK